MDDASHCTEVESLEISRIHVLPSSFGSYTVVNGGGGGDGGGGGGN